MSKTTLKLIYKNNKNKNNTTIQNAIKKTKLHSQSSQSQKRP